MQIFLLILAGIVGGIIGGMGMGGGTLLIPILTIFLDVEQKNAQAINLVAFIPMAIIVKYKEKGDRLQKRCARRGACTCHKRNIRAFGQKNII